jgi:hypothetical protein
MSAYGAAIRVWNMTFEGETKALAPGSQKLRWRSEKISAEDWPSLTGFIHE